MFFTAIIQNPSLPLPCTASPGPVAAVGAMANQIVGSWRTSEMLKVYEPRLVRSDLASTHTNPVVNRGQNVQHLRSNFAFRIFCVIDLRHLEKRPHHFSTLFLLGMCHERFEAFFSAKHRMHDLFPLQALFSITFLKARSSYFECRMGGVITGNSRFHINQC